MKFKLNFNLISIWFPFEMYWNFNWISIGFSLKFILNFNWIFNRFSWVFHWNFYCFFNKKINCFYWNFYWIFYGFPMDFHYYFQLDFQSILIGVSLNFPLELSTGFSMGYISIANPTDSSSIFTFPSSVRPFVTSVTSFMPIYIDFEHWCQYTQ